MVSITKFWFLGDSEKYWFNSTKEFDTKVKKLFEENVLIKTSLERIIFYDQIHRHIARANNKDYDLKYLELAVKESFNIIKDRENFKTKYNPKEHLFILLPIRHTRNEHNVELSIELIDYLSVDDPNNSYYRRFKNASIKELIKFQHAELTNSIKSFQDINKDIICPSCTFNSKNEYMNNKFTIPLELKNRFPKNESIVISLSGGVDSMTCLYLAKKIGYKHIIAVMINYTNRDTAYDEVDLVSWWCNQNNIQLYVRHITEINRTHDNRTFYENITKNIRFNSYRQFKNTPVILGHNKDDTLENILTNIRKQHYNNLIGMEDISLINEVEIYRPLLNTSKKQIREIANMVNLPYLRNSTPDWCQRGIIRNEIIENIPLDIQENLIDLSSFITDMYLNIQKSNMVPTVSSGKAIWKIYFEKNGIHVTPKSLVNFMKLLPRGCRVELNSTTYYYKGNFHER